MRRTVLYVQAYVFCRTSQTLIRVVEEGPEFPSSNEARFRCVSWLNYLFRYGVSAQLVCMASPSDCVVSHWWTSTHLNGASYYDCRHSELAKR